MEVMVIINELLVSFYLIVLTLSLQESVRFLKDALGIHHYVH